MTKTFALSAAALLFGCATTDPAAVKVAAAPLAWCNPCTYPCTSPCAPPAAVAAAPAKPKYVPPPTPALSASFDPIPGDYKDAQSVTLASPTPGAIVHYTTDGSTPTADSPVYSGPIRVEKTTTVRAVVTAAAAPESSVSEGEYVIAPPAPVAAPEPAPSPAPVAAPAPPSRR